jgi:hypothetical protein
VARDGHALVLEDLEDVLDELPERLVVGMGASSQMRPDPATLERLSEAGSRWSASQRIAP